MEALTAYAKYNDSYEKWCQMRKRYALHWTNGDESLQAMQRFFEPVMRQSNILENVKGYDTGIAYSPWACYQTCCADWTPTCRSYRVCEAFNLQGYLRVLLQRRQSSLRALSVF
jgi:hypothetical protein